MNATDFDKTAGHWVKVRVEDTCDGLVIHPDDAQKFGLPLDVRYPGKLLTDTTAMIFVNAPSVKSRWRGR